MNLRTSVHRWSLAVTLWCAACGSPTTAPGSEAGGADPTGAGVNAPGEQPPLVSPLAGLPLLSLTPGTVAAPQRWPAWPSLGTVALTSHLGQYVVAEGGGGGLVSADRSSAGVWETFGLESEALVLAHGTQVHLRAHLGQYLSAEGGGGSTLLATSPWAGPWETFTLVRAAGAGAVRAGDALALATFDGHFLVAEGGGGGLVRANRTSVGVWETFRLEVQTGAMLAPAFAGRHGKVRGSGKAFEDDDGRFNALGVTWMSALWMYKNDRPRCERWLEAMAANGFMFFRALGVVGDVTGPDYWDGRELDWRAPGYAADVAGLTDLAYDRFGLRVEWTLIGDGQKIIPAEADRYALMDTYAAMSVGREHKLMYFEVANEAWQNGFSGDAGRTQLRALTKYLKDRTEVLVAASAPDGYEQDTVEALYGGGVADLATVHFDRDSSKADGSWRPVRQPWEWQYYTGVPTLCSNNEPIGPGSSVASETDPDKLVAAALASWVSGVGAYVFHTRSGVRGDTDVMNEPGFTAFKPMLAAVPQGLAAWSQKNAHWADAPFKPYARDASGTMFPNAMWPDVGGSGAVRAFGVVDGLDFVVFPFGIKGRLTLEPRRDLEFDVIDTMTGQVLRHETKSTGQQFDLTGAASLILRGHYR